MSGLRCGAARQPENRKRKIALMQDKKTTGKIEENIFSFIISPIAPMAVKNKRDGKGK